MELLVSYEDNQIGVLFFRMLQDGNQDEQAYVHFANLDLFVTYEAACFRKGWLLLDRYGDRHAAAAESGAWRAWQAPVPPSRNKNHVAH